MKQKTAGRKLYSVGEAYMILYRALRTMPRFLRARKNSVLSEEFTERLMIAVTEVNQCAMCSYAHTKMALEAGIHIDEIKAMFSGDFSNATQDEMPAILFAQHYADSRGNPSKSAWESITKEYGNEKSIAVLGAIRMIMVGNTYGIPSGNFMSRFSKESRKNLDPRSSVPYELSMFATLILFLPVLLFHVPISAVLRTPLISFRQR